ncbi:MAG: serine hydrolase, partial [Betaproteobacteria bacterium]
WLNGNGTFPAPKEAFYMAGAGGQVVLIIPSHQLAIVRIGHYKGEMAAGRALRKAVAMIVDAVPATDR